MSFTWGRHSSLFPFSDRAKTIAHEVQQFHKVETEVQFHVVDFGSPRFRAAYRRSFPRSSLRHETNPLRRFPRFSPLSSLRRPAKPVKLVNLPHLPQIVETVETVVPGRRNGRQPDGGGVGAKSSAVRRAFGRFAAASGGSVLGIGAWRRALLE